MSIMCRTDSLPGAPVLFDISGGRNGRAKSAGGTPPDKFEFVFGGRPIFMGRIGCQRSNDKPICDLSSAVEPERETKQPSIKPPIVSRLPASNEPRSLTRPVAQRDKSTVDRQQDARHPAGFVGGKIHRAMRDVPGSAFGLHRNHFSAAFSRLRAEMTDHRRVHRTDDDAVGADVLGDVVGSDGQLDAVQSRLGGRMATCAGLPHEPDRSQRSTTP